MRSSVGHRHEAIRGVVCECRRIAVAIGDGEKFPTEVIVDSRLAVLKSQRPVRRACRTVSVSRAV